MDLWLLQDGSVFQFLQWQGIRKLLKVCLIWLNLHLPVKIVPLKPYRFACVLAAMLWPQVAGAYLGSFEEQDGYRLPVDGQILSAFLAGDAQFYLTNIDA